MFGVGGYLYTQALGMTITDVTPVLQLGIILPYAVWSSTLPDLDQDNSEVAAQSPFNLVIQKFFNAIKAGHRSARSKNQSLWESGYYRLLSGSKAKGRCLFEKRIADGTTIESAEGKNI